MSAWAELVTLAEGELQMIHDGRWEELAAASTRRTAFAESLGQAPASARADLERLAELQADITAGIAAARALTMGKLSRMTRAHGAIRGYAFAGGYRPASTSYGRF
jgi:hypothetical protein